ncbi:FAD-dependent oxidoreductase [Kutzneria chonburiensis]|uniref:Flavin-dependent monooxygenase n=1 Tax=Kutzneria chonburiensis TaxID=1483604 RepID=A0ABV6N7I2_9PSEU|nr:NAD(P)/FAD-dependent oxidoreductase [Kutzneria chonburiensis]
MNTPRIAVIGAGVAGLACARGLQIHGVPVTVYEREASETARWQGGMLDLHAPTGQAALRAIGLYDEFRAVARPEAQEMRMLDPLTAAILNHEEADDEYYAPEIDRGQLRELLLDSLAPETVHWGRPLVDVTTVDGEARVAFGDGTTEVFDLVVGADGAWSRVRPAVSDVLPVYTGECMVETHLDDIDTRHPELAELIGLGSMMAGAGGAMICTQRNSGGHVVVYAILEDIPLEWPAIAGVDMTDTDAVRAHLLNRFDGWHDGLLDLVRRSDGGFINRPIHRLPAHSWTHVPGATLLGDAAHLLPPHGIGANLALLDGSELAAAIVAHDDLDQAVRAYEAVMMPRSVAAARADVEIAALMDQGPDVDVNDVRKLFNDRMLNPVV